MAKGSILNQETDVSTLATKDELKQYSTIQQMQQYIDNKLATIKASPWIKMNSYHIDKKDMELNGGYFDMENIAWPENPSAFKFEMSNIVGLDNQNTKVAIETTNSRNVADMFTRTAKTISKNPNVISIILPILEVYDNSSLGYGYTISRYQDPIIYKECPLAIHQTGLMFNFDFTIYYME